MGGLSALLVLVALVIMASALVQMMAVYDNPRRSIAVPMFLGWLAVAVAWFAGTIPTLR